MVRRRGKILAIKLGMNPNSSSLGADVTFLLLGAAAVGVLTPLIAAMLRLRKLKRADAAQAAGAPPPA